jgi:RimJ/RimL family protein N-acetyltransferase
VGARFSGDVLSAFRRVPLQESLIKTLEPVTLEAHGVRLVPMTLDHAPGLARAAADGELWTLWYTSVPTPEDTRAYVQQALAGHEAGHMLPWVVTDAGSGEVLGTTRYHDVIPSASRVEIGYTWYAASHQRSHVNTACKLLLFRHAFETLECRVVGLRTDNFNFRSQRAIEALGAKRDGMIRHHQLRRDGTVRDTVLYSVRDHEWPDVARHLAFRLARHGI